MIMMNIYNMVLKRPKFSARCDYSDDKQMGEHLRHMQYMVIMCVMVIKSLW